MVLIDIVSLTKEIDFLICLVTTDAATETSSVTSSTGASSTGASSTGASSTGVSSTGASSFCAGAALAAILSPPAHEFKTSSTEIPDACALASADL